MKLFLQFQDGPSIGSWPTIPDPDKQPVEFVQWSKEIGFHIALEFSRGKRRVDLVDEDGK